MKTLMQFALAALLAPWERSGPLRPSATAALRTSGSSGGHHFEPIGGQVQRPLVVSAYPIQ